MTIARADLLAEISTTLDGSGNYVGPWIDTAETLSVRVIYSGSQPQVDESMDAATALNSGSVTNGTVTSLTARYFRLSVTGGVANSAFHASVRHVS